MVTTITPDYSMKRTWGPEPRYPSVARQLPGWKTYPFISVAGPCAVESEAQIRKIAAALAKTGCSYMRGGVYRAGTYPPEGKFGLQKDMMLVFAAVAKEYKLKTVMEVLDIRQIEMMAADALQVGARHMQDYALLDELSRQEKPVFLKRHPGATLDEFLGAAEYLCRHGKTNITLIERGSSTHMNHVRWDLSISLIAAVKTMTSLPILIDASHGTGRADLVEPMTLAGISAGADGFLIELQHKPDMFSSDAQQATPLAAYAGLVAKAKKIRRVIHGQ